MKRPMETAQWSDCETDQERAEYLVSGRVSNAGMNRRMLVTLVAKAFEDAAKWRAHTADFALKWDAGTHQFFDDRRQCDGAPAEACPALGSGRGAADGVSERQAVVP